MCLNTTPFAYDFNVISKNITKHQILVTDVEQKLISMGLVVKTRKCRSLSIQEGKYTNINFQLRNKASEDPIKILSILDNPMKFLGSEVTGDITPHAMFVFLSSKLSTKLDNIDKSTLRGEYKLNIYRRFALPSIRFYFSVHHIHKTHMNELDGLVRKYIKKWLGIQTNGVSDTSIFHPYMLGVKMPSQLYIEAHAGTYSTIRLKGDTLVNHALDSRLERESEWTRKFSTIKTVHDIFQENITSGQITYPENVSAPIVAISKAKKATNASIQAQTLSLWNGRVKKLTFQGDFINLLIEEQSNITWQSISNRIPKGVLSFALKASVNGLNTPDNLKRWGKSPLDKCKLCGNFGNLEHTLNWCSVALNQGRTKWRHDSVLNYMYCELMKGKDSEVTIYTDLPDHQINGGTIPADILTTSQRPDIVLIDRKYKKIAIFELTISFEKNIDSANLRKFLKYQELTEDLRNRGWETENVPFEVGSRGLVTKRNKKSISDILKKWQIKTKKSQIFNDISKISLLCSFALFQAHCQPAWQSPPLLHP
jgi:hypothetical protein